jgi:hypothetical protein
MLKLAVFKENNNYNLLLAVYFIIIWNWEIMHMLNRYCIFKFKYDAVIYLKHVGFQCKSKQSR